MPTIEIKKYQNTINHENLLMLLKHMSNISSIDGDQDVKLTIDSEYIHIYSAVKSGNLFSSYKGCRLNTSDFFEDDIENEFNWVIYKVKEFIKLFSNFNPEKSISFKFYISAQSNYVSQVEATDGKLKMNYLGGDRLLLPDLKYKHIEAQLQQNPIVEIEFTDDLFKQIKSLNKAKLKREDKLKDVVSVNVEDGKVIFSDVRWNIQITETDITDRQFYFKKKFITQCTDPNSKFIFYDKFLLIEDRPYSIIAALELTNI